MSHLVRARIVLAALALPAISLLTAAPAANAAGPLTLTSRVDAAVTVLQGDDRVALGDFNGDGIDDHAIGNGGSVVVYFGARGAADGGGTLTLTGAGSAVAEAGDPDGDGIDDLLIHGGAGATRTQLVYGATSNPSTLNVAAGGPRVTTIVTGSWGAGSPHSVGIGDFDGDGRDDMIVSSKSGTGLANGTSSASIVAGGPRAATINAVGAGPRVSVILGFRKCTTNFLFSAPYIVTKCRAPDPDVVPIGDFNGDGKADLYVNPKEGPTQAIILGRSGTGGTIASMAPGAGSVNLSAVAGNAGLAGFWGSVHALGDVDGDRFADFGLPVNNALGGGSAIVRGRANLPAALPASEPVLRIADGTLISTAGDQTGDGRTDLLLQRGTGAAVASLPAGATSFTRANQTDVVGNFPTPYGPWRAPATVGDLDGDGALDALLFDGQFTVRLTHTGPPVKPRVTVSTLITTATPSGPTPSIPQTLTLTCNGVAQTQTGRSWNTFEFGADGSISSGERCTFATTQTLPTGPEWEGCTWTTKTTFRGAPIEPNATFTIGTDPNVFDHRILCAKQPDTGSAGAFPVDFQGWQSTGGAYSNGDSILSVNSGPLGNAAYIWPTPVNLNGKAIDFTLSMSGGTGAAEGLTLAFLDNEGGVPSGGYGRTGESGQLGFGGRSGTALAFDVFKQPEDAQPNTVSWVDGVDGSSLRKVYSKDAGLRLRGTAIAVRVVIKDGKLTATLNGKFVHSVARTLPNSVFLAFTGTTAPTVWQRQGITGIKITDAP